MLILILILVKAKEQEVLVPGMVRCDNSVGKKNIFLISLLHQFFSNVI